MNYILAILMFFNAYLLMSKNYELLIEGRSIAEKIYALKADKNDYFRKISMFHDVPLYVNDSYDIFTMIVEIPKGNQIKREINKKLYLNPITPDIKDGKIRKVTYKTKQNSGYPHHYGALPQTWEHIGKKDPHTGLFGDNDPIDAFDISLLKRSVGDIIQVKILGAIAMIDNNETDWKLIVINAKDPQAKNIDDIEQIPNHVIHIIYDFLENYKTPDGKPKNTFFSKKFWNKKEAINIIHEMHKNWQNLCNNSLETKEIVQENRPDMVDEIPKCR